MLDIVKYPDPTLSSECDDVIVFGQEIKAIADCMIETMYASGGVGLAANQVGTLRNVVLVDPTSGDDANELLVLVNPKIVWTSTEKKPGEEGCLSLPGVTLSVLRSIACDVEYLDLSGALKLARCVGLKARIVQHEIDHLKGVTMLDRVDSFARRSAIKKLQTKR